MLPQLFFDEALHFFTRDELDRLHMVAKVFHGLIDSSKTMALRPVHSVYVGCDEFNLPNGPQVWVDLTENEDVGPPDFKEQLSLNTFDLIRWRLNNCFFEIAVITFSERAFLQYWLPRTSSRAGFFQFDVVPDATNIDMMDLAMSHLRPTSFNLGEVDATTWNSQDGMNSEFLALLDRPSLQATIHTCTLRVYENAMPPPGFILKDGALRNYNIMFDEESCFPDEWIDLFIERFIDDGISNEVVESVELQWDADEYLSREQCHRGPKCLRVPSKTDVPIPRNDFVERRIDGDSRVHSVSPCSMTSFRCKKRAQQLKVYAWTVIWGENWHTEAYLFLFKDL